MAAARRAWSRSSKSAIASDCKFAHLAHPSGQNAATGRPPAGSVSTGFRKSREWFVYPQPGVFQGAGDKTRAAASVLASAVMPKRCAMASNGVSSSAHSARRSNRRPCISAAAACIGQAKQFFGGHPIQHKAHQSRHQNRFAGARIGPDPSRPCGLRAACGLGRALIAPPPLAFGATR